MYSFKNIEWGRLVLIAAILVYVVYFGMAYYTFTHMPPIPDEVVTKGGRILFTGDDIIQGKILAQKYGLLDYGSVLGFGGYFGIDYTSYTLAIIAEEAGWSPTLIQLKNASNNDEINRIREILAVSFDPQHMTLLEYTKGRVVVSDDFGRGFDAAVNYFTRFFGSKAESVGLKPNLITDNESVRKIVAFFTWTAMIALAGYTNGFPYMPGLVEPHLDVVQATWVTFLIFIIAVMIAAGYIMIKFIDLWREPRIRVDLPPPDDVQRLALLGMALAVLGLSIQGLLGGYVMHKYTDPETLYGIKGINSILPYNVARGLHYNLAVLWLVISWVSFSLFALPYLGVRISRRQAFLVLGAGVLTAAGILLGLWASYLRLIPDPYWFIIGSQGRPVISQGSLYLILIAVLAWYLSYLFYKASRTGPEVTRPFSKILSIALAGTGVGAFIGSLPITAPWPHFVVDEYFRWITIHAFVEGFWPPIVVTILVLLLVLTGVVPPALGLAVAGLDAVLEIATGMIGTAHHYYWGGQPTMWLYVGAVFSTLEALPLGFLIAYSLILWRRSGLTNELQKTIVTFITVAGIGGVVGVIGFGAGLINMPIINYYIHGAQGTMVHAHLAMPLSYGVPTMLMWIVAFYLSGGFGDSWLRRFRYAIVVFAAGFYIQAFLSLMPLMIKQFSLVTSFGYWSIKGIETPWGGIGIWEMPDVKTFVWLRFIGDVIAAIAIAVFLIPMWLKLPKIVILKR
ncbi:MAG: nitric-oxide reductase large subunit [Sulfolobales archaeon]